MLHLATVFEYEAGSAEMGVVRVERGESSLAPRPVSRLARAPTTGSYASDEESARIRVELSPRGPSQVTRFVRSPITDSYASDEDNAAIRKPLRVPSRLATAPRRAPPVIPPRPRQAKEDRGNTSS